LGDIFDRQDGLIQLSPVDFFLGTRGFFYRLELDECVVSLHFNTHKFSVGFKEHLQIFTFRRRFLKVDHKEGIRRLNALTTVVLLAFDAAIAASKLNSKGW
jgi:hypothetical protein